MTTEQVGLLLTGAALFGAFGRNAVRWLLTGYVSKDEIQKQTNIEMKAAIADLAKSVHDHVVLCNETPNSVIRDKITEIGRKLEEHVKRDEDFADTVHAELRSMRENHGEALDKILDKLEACLL